MGLNIARHGFCCAAAAAAMDSTPLRRPAQPAAAGVTVSWNFRMGAAGLSSHPGSRLPSLLEPYNSNVSEYGMPNSVEKVTVSRQQKARV